MGFYKYWNWCVFLTAREVSPNFFRSFVNLKILGDVEIETTDKMSDVRLFIIIGRIFNFFIGFYKLRIGAFWLEKFPPISLEVSRI